MSSVKLISITKPLVDGLSSAEDIMVYCARVSNPNNQLNTETGAKLLHYCLKNSHFSIFEMVNVCLEIETSIPIAMQIIRHKSFCFQQFSARYSSINDLTNQFSVYPARRQDAKNRQNSIDDLSEGTRQWFIDEQQRIQAISHESYNKALELGIAKESARFLLPQLTNTRMYMSGSVRSWITYLMVRLENGTQLEHRLIAEQCWEIFKKELPIVAEALIKNKPEIFK